MDISLYFEPVPEFILSNLVPGKPVIGNVIKVFNEGGGFPDTSEYDIAIFGVPDERGAVNNDGCEHAPDEFRKYIYELFPGAWNARIADLGNLKKGHTDNDTIFALAEVMSFLIGNKIFPIVIGGSQSLTFGMYKAYESLEKIINISVIDPRFDLGGGSPAELHSQNYLSKIILLKPNYLFNFTNIGYQTYFVDQSEIELMNKLLFDSYRLGQINNDFREIEPLVRNADLISFDMGAIRAADAPGNGNTSPNGFTGEQACQIARYAAMSDKLSSIGFFESNPLFDHNGITSYLLAEVVWYILEGISQRKRDYPSVNSDDFIKYTVPTADFKDGIVFYKSRKTDRWWMEVICGNDNQLKYASHYMVPCSYNDYLTACNNEIPDRWWQVYQKLM